ncbi:hypothetical protein [Robertkochia aurantiaca]|uniref:hypothetical protein n=1 Tax=Robertkochia aurantiaca TaxID=2873700 RepID=UPI001CCB8D10|nr:hypothetical protein [Robertkochia sp. 3YJGBD-33]
MFKKVNVEDKLRRYRNKGSLEESVLEQVKDILQNHRTSDSLIQEKLEKPHPSHFNDFNAELLETDRIYHIDQIKQICIDYRLRFLSTKYFKGKFPKEALEQIKELEKNHDTQLKGFKIMAPSKLFKLENADDPLLFAPIGNDYFYLVHKWGNDLHPLRKLLVLPFKSMGNLILLIILLSYLITAVMPLEIFTRDESAASFWLLYFFVFKMVASIVIFYGFALGKNFNTAIWNSKYFNA